jgi:light-regulated signal transduction histidine kinase (bacteriophytochrome)
VREAISELDLEIEKSEANIEIKELPVVCAIPSMMRQLFHNLISNALKFRKKDQPPRIVISAEKINKAINGTPIRMTEGVPYYRITVSDNGIGFDPKYAEEIFMVFKRLHSYHEFAGTGVGLSICKKIVDKHHGFITAEGRQDKGSKFIVGLPERQQGV